METAAVADVVQRSRDSVHGACGSISDEYNQVLPAGALAAGFDAGQGPGRRRCACWLISPVTGAKFRPFIQFVSNLGRARQNLTRFLQQMNDELPRNL